CGSSAFASPAIRCRRSHAGWRPCAVPPQARVPRVPASGGRHYRTILRVGNFAASSQAVSGARDGPPGLTAALDGSERSLPPGAHRLLWVLSSPLANEERSSATVVGLGFAGFAPRSESVESPR